MKPIILSNATAIDPMRVGGPLSRRRNAFIGNAPMMAAPVDPAKVSAIRSAIGDFLDSAYAEMSQINRYEVKSAIDASGPGAELAREEWLGQALIDAGAIDQLVGKFSSGSAASYLTEGSRLAIDDIHSAFAKIEDAIVASSVYPKTPSDSAISDQILSSHLDHLSKAASDVEKLIVSAESDSVPVLEPDEKSSVGIVGPLIGVGLIAAASYVLFLAMES